MAELTTFLNTVAGKKAEAVAFYDSFDPFTGKPWARIPRCDAKDAEAAVAAAKQAFKSGPWRGLTASARGRLLVKLADLIEADADRLAAIEVHDNGKLLAEMSAQVKYLPQWF